MDYFEPGMVSCSRLLRQEIAKEQVKNMSLESSD